MTKKIVGYNFRIAFFIWFIALVLLLFGEKAYAEEKQFFSMLNPIYTDEACELCDIEADGNFVIYSTVDLPSFLASNEEDNNYALEAHTHFASIEAAADFLEEKMVMRVNEITFTLANDFLGEIEYTNDNVKKGIIDIFNLALEDDETCTGQEGDALKFVWDKISASYLFEDNKYIVKIYMQYFTSLAQEQELTAAVNEVIEYLELDKLNDYEKVLKIHNYICDNVDYDNVNNSDNYKLKYTAYAALINGRAVCQGYATLFYRMCKEVGLSVRVIGGEANSTNHTWNIVRIGNLYYNIDLTWDGETIVTNKKYFLLCDAEFLEHYRNNEYVTEEFYSRYKMAKQSFDYSSVVKTLGYSVELSSVYELKTYIGKNSVLNNRLENAKFYIKIGDSQYEYMCTETGLVDKAALMDYMDEDDVLLYDEIYMITIPIYPVQINENITIEYEDGAYQAKFKYSLREYLDSLVYEPNFLEEYQMIESAIWEYSNSVISYFDYEEINPVYTNDGESENPYGNQYNSNYEDMQNSLINLVREQIVDNSSLIDFYGASLVCDKDLGMKLYFTVDDKYSNYTVESVDCDDNSVVGFEYKFTGDNIIYIGIRDIKYGELDSIYTVKLIDGNGDVIIAKYSPLNYIEKAVENNYNFKLQKLATNLCMYFKAIENMV